MKTTFWTLFEISVNVYQSIMAAYFVRTFLGTKLSARTTRNFTAVFICIYTAAICFENYLGPIELFGGFKPYYAAVYIVLLAIYAFCVLKGSIAKKIFAAAFANVIILLSSALCGNAAALIFDEEFAYLLYTPSVERFLVIISVQLLVFYLMFISLRLLRQVNGSDSLFHFEWAIITVTLSISLLTAAYINYVAMGKDDNLRLYSLFVFMCIILTNIIVCYLLTELSSKRRVANEVNLLKKTREYNNQYIEALQSDQDVVRKMRHDYRNGFLTVYTLLENGETNEAKEHIQKIIGIINETEVFIKTNNTVVNAVVNAKLSTTKSLNIESECLVMSDISGIDDVDICRLLSNMLDNAITACQGSIGVNKRICLSIRGDNGNYIFTVKNTIDESVIAKNPQLISTKKNRNEHGFGIRIIREIAKSYDGRSDFYEENGMFCCSVYLRRKDM